MNRAPRFLFAATLTCLLLPFTHTQAATDDAKTKSQPAGVMSKEAVFKHCSPQAVDITIIGHDNQGQWASYGAGSVLHENGYILTAEHVTATGDKHIVTLHDGTHYEYEVISRAGGSYDTAIIKIKPQKPLTPVKLGRSDTVKKGDQAMTIGNAAGHPHTVNYGIIERPTCGGGTQIHIGSADIKGGDSGGPVFNMKGEQIAHVHVKIFTMHNASRHIRVDHVRHAFANVFGKEDRNAFTIGIAVDCLGNEAKVTEVAEGSPAEKAGVKVGDVITQFDDMRIGSGPHYVLALMDRVTKNPVKLTLKRNGSSKTISVTPKKN